MRSLCLNFFMVSGVMLSTPSITTAVPFSDHWEIAASCLTEWSGSDMPHVMYDPDTSNFFQCPGTTWGIGTECLALLPVAGRFPFTGRADGENYQVYQFAFEYMRDSNEPSYYYVVSRDGFFGSQQVVALVDHLRWNEGIERHVAYSGGWTCDGRKTFNPDFFEQATTFHECEQTDPAECS